MTNNMKRFIMALLVLVMSISLLAVPGYAAEETLEVKIPVSVKLTGHLPEKDETFLVQLKAENAAFPMPSGASNGVYTLPLVGEDSDTLDITFDRLGVYSYTITQLKGKNENCYQDESIYDLKVFVVNKPDYSGLQVNAVLTLRGAADDAEKPNEVVFTNRYAEPVVVPITAIKTLNNKTPNDRTFTFKLETKSGKLVEQVENIGQAVDFTALEFDKTGEYVYKMYEIIGPSSKIRYDKSVYTITIDVEKDENGDYVADVSYKRDGISYEGTPRFANKTKSSTPQTGDMFRLYLWVGVMVVSLIAIVVLLGFRFKKKR